VPGKPSATSAEAGDRHGLQRRTLRRNRLVATGLLALMALLFAASEPLAGRGFWYGLLNAVAEAGLIGGLADWFAVTALFRRPLGLPIPHTAIIPRNKARIADGIGSFLEQYFLSAELVLAKVRAVDPAGRLADWLAAPGQADAVAGRIVRALPHLIQGLDDVELRRLTASSVGRQLEQLDVAPLLGRLLRLLTEGGYHEALLDRALAAATDYLEENAGELEEAAGAGRPRPWWMPEFVDRKIAGAVIRWVRKRLQDLTDEDHELRHRLLTAIDAFADELRHDRARQSQVNEMKRRILDSAELQGWLTSIWDQFRDYVLADLARPDSLTREAVATALSSFGNRLRAEPEMRQQVNRVVEGAVRLALPWRRELAAFVSEVVRRWDERELVDRLELEMGPDLQYVRMTGTLVGGLIGALLFLAGHLMAGSQWIP
jgi:uncharacterized membrane-anchored protein YjiN (DUF445 family)